MKKFILDEIDHQILDILIENARTPFTDIAKKLVVSAGTIHVRVKKMEDEGIIKGSTLTCSPPLRRLKVSEFISISENRIIIVVILVFRSKFEAIFCRSYLAWFYYLLFKFLVYLFTK